MIKRNKELIIDSIILLPLFWCFSGMFVFANGDKILNGLVLFALIIRLSFIGYKDILENIRQNKFLWLISLNLMFAIVAYFTYGISSSKFRMISLAFIYLSILPQSYLDKFSFRNLTWLLSASTVAFLLIQYFDGNLFNRDWTINPIRVGIISAFLINANIYFAIVEKDKTLKLVSLALATTALFPLILSVSRGPWLAFGVGSVILLVRVFNLKMLNYKVVFSSILILLSVGVTLKNPIEQRIERTVWEFQQIQSDKMDSSIGLRLQMWKAGVQIIKSHWLLGVGDTGQVEIKEQMIKENTYTPEAAKFNHFHNQWINDLAKYGIFGIVITLLLVIYPLCSSKGVENRTLIWVLISIYLTLSLTDMPLERSHPFVFYLFSMYLLLSGNIATKTTNNINKSVNSDEIYCH